MTLEEACFVMFVSLFVSLVLWREKGTGVEENRPVSR